MNSSDCVTIEILNVRSFQDVGEHVILLFYVIWYAFSLSFRRLENQRYISLKLAATQGKPESSMSCTRTYGCGVEKRDINAFRKGAGAKMNWKFNSMLRLHQTVSCADPGIPDASWHTLSSQEPVQTKIWVLLTKLSWSCKVLTLQPW